MGHCGLLCGRASRRQPRRCHPEGSEEPPRAITDGSRRRCIEGPHGGSSTTPVVDASGRNPAAAENDGPRARNDGRSQAHLRLTGAPPPPRSVGGAGRAVRIAFRQDRKSSRLYQKSFRLYQKAFRLYQKSFRLYQKPFRLYRKAFRLYQKAFRLDYKPSDPVEKASGPDYTTPEMYRPACAPAYFPPDPDSPLRGISSVQQRRSMRHACYPVGMGPATRNDARRTSSQFATCLRPRIFPELSGDDMTWRRIGVMISKEVTAYHVSATACP